MEKHTFNISGLRCNSCKMVLEDVLGEESKIQNAQVNLADKTLSVESEITDPQVLSDLLNSGIRDFGYEVSDTSDVAK